MSDVPRRPDPSLESTLVALHDASHDDVADTGKSREALETLGSSGEGAISGASQQQTSVLRCRDLFFFVLLLLRFQALIWEGHG